MGVAFGGDPPKQEVLLKKLLFSNPNCMKNLKVGFYVFSAFVLHMSFVLEVRLLAVSIVGF